MAQPQAYNRETDFTERDGDDTNHAGINTELDAAALSINELRDNLALIQRDDGALKNGIVTAESLSDSAFNAVLGEVATATAAASASADRATLFATQAEADRIAAQAEATAAQSSQTAAAGSATAAASSQTAAENSATSAATSASTATTKANEASTSATNAATSATAAAGSATTASTQATNAAASATAAATSATNAANSATTATTQAEIAATQASNAAASATNAAASFADFNDRYLGAKSTAPTVDNDGNPLQVGTLYFDTVLDQMRVYTPTGWGSASSSVNGTSARFRYIATAGQATFTGVDSNGNTLAYDAGFVDVYLNGARLDQSDYTASSGTSIVLASGASVGDQLNIIAFGTFTIANLNAGQIAATDGAAGSLFTTVAGFITRLMSSVGSALMGFIQSGTGAVQRTAQDKMREVVSVKDFGAVGDGVADDTSKLQAAITAAQNSTGVLYVPTGFYKTTDTLQIDGSKPLRMYGAGNASFNGTTLRQIGTVIKLATQNKPALSIVGGEAVKYFEHFSLQNISGGTAEIGIGSANGDRPTFAYFNSVTIDGFEHGVKFERSLYLVFDKMMIRNCTYGIDCWQFTGTPPYSLNDTGANGYFNNVITLRDCQVVYGSIAYRLVGACIDVKNCDASGYTNTGFVFGGSNFGSGTVSADQLYTEASSGTAISITNMSASLGTVFLGGSDSIGIDVNSCNVTIDNLNAYGSIATGVKNTNGKVFISGGVTGAITTVFTNYGTGVTRTAYQENIKQIVADVSNGSYMTVTTEGTANRTYQLDVYGSENGTSNFAFRVVQRGGAAYIIGTKPNYLTVQSLINANGNYDVRITNNAGFAYGFTIFVNYSPSFYSVAL